MTQCNQTETPHAKTHETDRAPSQALSRLSWQTPTLVAADIAKTAANVDSFTDGVTSTGYRYGS